MSRGQDLSAPTVREQLMVGAIEHIRATGVSDLSTRALAAAGGRSTMCLYTKFQSRQGLIDAVYAEQGEELIRRLERAAEPARELWNFAVDEPRVYGFLFEAELDLIGVPVNDRTQLLESVLTALDPDGERGRRRWAIIHGMAGLARHGHPVSYSDVVGAAT